jgi:PelA/Pel-15E family pectate lyase
MKRILELNLPPGRFVFALACFLCQLNRAAAANAGQYLKETDAWFQTPAARRIADNILTWQAPAGDWPKNGDTVSQSYTGDTNKLHGTFDNGATTGEIRFLARAYNATRDARYKAAALKGIDHLLAAQYPTGGWPQYSPPPANSYHRYITFNDNAMVRVLETLREVATSAGFDFVDPPRRDAAQKAFDRGITCILRCQIKVNGKLTVWCAQHDEKDFSPRPARKYELVSLSGGESAGILHLLMTLEPPGPEVIRSIQAGAEWFAAAKITGIRQTRVDRNKVIVADTNAPALWARFYDIKTGRPLFSGRDSVPKYTLAEIEAERRNGYAWYGPWGEQVATDYAAWSPKWLKPTSKTP